MDDFVEIFGNADSESDEEFYGFEEFEVDIDSDDDVVEEVNLDDPTIDAMQMNWLVDFDEETGPREVPDDLSEIGCFELFFTDEVIALIVRETNRYAREYIEAKGDNMATYARARTWKDVSRTEIRAFLSILMVMGLSRKPSYESYWSSDPLLECKGFKAIMSRDRFLQIHMFFHLNNNAFDFPKEDQRHDKLFKIRPLMDLLLAGWQRHYYPQREVSVDESMIAFKGRTALKQYMPSKPNKWGIKSWCLADSRSGYTGKPAEGREFGLAHTVVTSLCEPLYLSGHHVYMDNFFSSPKLFQELAKNGTGACGTLRSYRKEVPQAVKDAKPRAGDNPSRYREGNLLYITWTDRRKVNLLTTIHNWTCFRKEVRTRTPPYRRQVSKPKPIQLYSKHMGGVDRADKQLQYYQVLHRCCKWWKKVFLYLLEICFSNAVIIFKTRYPDRRFNAERFRLNLATGLLFGYARQGGGRPGRRSASLERPLRLTERHFLAKVKKAQSGRLAYADCVVSSDRLDKRHQSSYFCKSCQVPLCPAPLQDQVLSCPSRRIENILEGDLSESDYETSSDEYIPTSENGTEDEVDVTPKKKRKLVKNFKPQNNSGLTADSSDNEDLPLAAIRRMLTSDPESDDGIPIANLRHRFKVTEELKAAEEDDLLSQLLETPFWESEEFFTPDSSFKGSLEEPPRDGGVKEPIDYFKAMITEKMIENLAMQTNLYSLQKEGISVNTTSREISILIGIYLRMGLVVAHSVQAYWAVETRYPMVADLMSRNRFQKLLSSVHMVDNTSVTDDNKRDKVWKIRPWLEDIKENFKRIPQEEHSAVDEVMIPFKGKSSVKQYMRNKPHKWGFKMWGRAGASGLLYEFEVYQGAAGNVKERSALGMTGEVVMRMTSTVPEGLNYKVFADNLFTSLELVKQLNMKGILYVGTVRMNRLKGCQLKDEKTLRKEGRGSMYSKVELNTGVIALRWYDNRTVDLVSSYVGKDPVQEVKRFDRKERKNIMVTCPKIVQEYNTFMGGIDLLDSLTSFYKPGIKSRRWYMYIWFHTLHIALVNAWLHYRRHCKLLGMDHHMKLCTFQGRVAGSLVSRKQSVGRPRATDFSPPPSRTVRRGLLTPEVRLDQVSHLPEWSTERGRCKNRNCTYLTFVMCSKRKEYACFVKERNCFAQFQICK